MRRQFRLNTKLIKNLGWATLVASGFMGGVSVVSYGVYSLVKPDQEREDYYNLVRDMDEHEKNGIEYDMEGPHTLYFREGGVSYTFNFSSELVTIDGRDDADEVRDFSQMNKDFVEAAHESGCKIAAGILDIVNDPDNKQTLAYDEKRADWYKNAANVFQTNYCTNMPELANTP